MPGAGFLVMAVLRRAGGRVEKRGSGEDSVMLKGVRKGKTKAVQRKKAKARGQDETQVSVDPPAVDMFIQRANAHACLVCWHPGLLSR
jgi:hypothetical protein